MYIYRVQYYVFFCIDASFIFINIKVIGVFSYLESWPMLCITSFILLKPRYSANSFAINATSIYGNRFNNPEPDLGLSNSTLIVIGMRFLVARVKFNELL